jgi:hypothetical protein
MKGMHLADYQLLRLETNGNALADSYAQVARGIRAVDYVGLLDDERVYVLLSQANRNNAEHLIERLSALGMASVLVEEQPGLAA